MGQRTGPVTMTKWLRDPFKTKRLVSTFSAQVPQLCLILTCGEAGQHGREPMMAQRYSGPRASETEQDQGQKVPFKSWPQTPHLAPSWESLYPTPQYLITLGIHQWFAFQGRVCFLRTKFTPRSPPSQSLLHQNQSLQHMQVWSTFPFQTIAKGNQEFALPSEGIKKLGVMFQHYSPAAETRI